jgi:hypothetical protein
MLTLPIISKPIQNKIGQSIQRDKEKFEVTIMFEENCWYFSISDDPNHENGVRFFKFN